MKPSCSTRATALMMAPILVMWAAVSAQVVTNFERSPSESDSLERHHLRARLVLMSDIDGPEATQTSPSDNYTPVVFWHGMGDTANGSININRLALEQKFPGIKVFSVQIGSSVVEDELASYFVNVNQQIDQVCQEILQNQVIKRSGSMNAIGFSQGAQFMRALVQRCPLIENNIRVKSLISLGGQHQGVFGLPNCWNSAFCDYIRYMLSTGAYESHVQEHLVQAEYWHDPLNEKDYRAKNIFLPDVNNENQINHTYRNNLLALDKLVLVQFLQDEMVVPRESSLFAFYEPGRNKEILPLEESPIYLEDRLGLRQLNDSGRLKMISIPGGHLQYKMSWFLEEIAAKYLDN